MARFIALALFLFALVAATLANQRPVVKKQYQLAVSGSCGHKALNLICTAGVKPTGYQLSSPFLESQVSSSGKPSVTIRLQEIKKAGQGASRD